jgi:predicted nucleic acid-binding protein
MSYLFDTNIVIYYFNGLTADGALHQLLAERFKISVITKIEFLGWSEFASDPKLYSQARAFIGHAQVFDLSAEIVEQTIRLHTLGDGLWRETGRFADRDQVRAAPFDAVVTALDDLWAS